jgi:hypothetical protein
VLGTHCLNCDAALSGPFCSACGQRELELQRPFFALAGDVLGAAFNFDSRAWRTLGLALIAPGLVARRYVDGKRASYVGPANLYALATFVFFVVLSVSEVGLVVLLPDANGGIGIVVSGDEASGAPGTRIVSSGFTLEAFVPLARARAAEAGPGLPMSLDAHSDAATQQRVEKLLGGVGALTADPARTNELLEKWLPRLLILLVPLFALVLKAVRRGALVFEHAVFSLYFHAFLFLLLTLLVGAAAATASLAAPLPFARAFALVAIAVLGVSLHHAYGGSFARTAASLAACVAGYGFVFFVALNALVFYELR